MKRNILINGSRGFVGTHLRNKLKNEDITLNEFNHKSVSEKSK